MTRNERTALVQVGDMVVMEVVVGLGGFGAGDGTTDTVDAVANGKADDVGLGEAGVLRDAGDFGVLGFGHADHDELGKWFAFGGHC